MRWGGEGTCGDPGRGRTQDGRRVALETGSSSELTRSALWSRPTFQPTKSKWAFCRLLKIGTQ